jgi:hypothetical protein
MGGVGKGYVIELLDIARTMWKAFVNWDEAWGIRVHSRLQNFLIQLENNFLLNKYVIQCQFYQRNFIY